MYYKVIAANKKAYHEYFIEDTIEAGLVLYGSEVKSLRSGKGSIKESYITVKDGEVFLIGAHIPEYKFSTYDKQDPLRTRKLLLSKIEITKLKNKIERQGYTAVPTKLYFKGNYAKIEIGIAKGKQIHDKRSSIKEKEEKRNLDRFMKNRY
ncbi:SsrA-binding protein SmpB [bacterium]|nr:SsrA-binding protein SmpB [bacterium]